MFCHLTPSNLVPGNPVSCADFRTFAGFDFASSSVKVESCIATSKRVPGAKREIAGAAGGPPLRATEDEGGGEFGGGARGPFPVMGWSGWFRFEGVNVGSTAACFSVFATRGGE